MYRRSTWIACSAGAALCIALVQAARAGGPAAPAQPRLFLPGVVSSRYSEVRAALSPDGHTVLWGSTNRPGGPGGWDIWISRRERGDWSPPHAVAFDTAHNEFDPAFDAQGRHVYFFSNRPGGFGGDDIYRVDFDPRTGAFGAVEHLDSAVNSAGDEWAPTPLPDGSGLLFASDGRGGRGGHDLFRSDRRDGRWQPAQPLPGAVNGAEDDFDAAVVEGGLVFARSHDVESAPIALWYAARTAEGTYATPVRLGPDINVEGGFSLGPSVDLRVPGRLLFSSQRPGLNRGRADIYAIDFHPPR